MKGISVGKLFNKFLVQPLILTLILLFICPFLVACGQTVTADNNPAVAAATPVISTTKPTPNLQIRSLQTQDNQSWVLTNQGLLTRTDNDNGWVNITPGQVNLAGLRGFYFLNSSQGWLLVSGATDAQNATPLDIYSTSDGGKSWKNSELAKANGSYTDAYSGEAYLDFVDSQHGWVMVQLASSANFRQGQLFKTADGGITWQQLNIPVGDHIHFINTTTGWVAGGPAGNQLFKTTDGGQNWQPQKVTLPADFAGVNPTYTTPQFQSPTSGVLPVTLNTGDKTALAFYVTADGGQTWTASTVINLTSPLADGVAVPVQVVSGSSWFYADPGTVNLHKAGPHASQVEAASGLPKSAAITQLSYTTQDKGLVLTQTNQCASAKTQCSSQTQLFATTDGGDNWVEVTP